MKMVKFGVIFRDMHVYVMVEKMDYGGGMMLNPNKHRQGDRFRKVGGVGQLAFSYLTCFNIHLSFVLKCLWWTQASGDYLIWVIAMW